MGSLPKNENCQTISSFAHPHVMSNPHYLVYTKSRTGLEQHEGE